MRVLSVNCGLPRQFDWHGRPVTTSIYKEPVEGRVALRTLNLDGDRQSDLTVHGGKDKAVYCYPVEHYEYWREQLAGHDLPMGVFGENLTIEGLPFEHDLYVDDRFSIGSAEVVVTQPRLPCYKLGIRFGIDAMVKRFLDAGRTGFYLAVTREGDVGAGDEIRMLSRAAGSVPVSEILRLYIAKGFNEDDTKQVRRALETDALPESWKEYFREKLARQG